MKILLPTVLLSLALAASAQAAVTAGFSAGYLIDNEEEYLAARLGKVFKTVDKISHTGEVEIGFTSTSDEDIDGDLLPLMANYRMVIASTSKYGGYVGAGLGMSRVKISGYGLSDSDWAFTAQVFAGYSYELSDTSSFTIGARYINIGDVTMFEDLAPGGVNEEIGDDIAIEAGFHFRF